MRFFCFLGFHSYWDNEGEGALLPIPGNTTVRYAIPRMLFCSYCGKKKKP